MLLLLIALLPFLCLPPLNFHISLFYHFSFLSPTPSPFLLLVFPSFHFSSFSFNFLLSSLPFHFSSFPSTLSYLPFHFISLPATSPILPTSFSFLLLHFLPFTSTSPFLFTSLPFLPLISLSLHLFSLPVTSPELLSYSFLPFLSLSFNFSLSFHFSHFSPTFPLSSKFSSLPSFLLTNNYLGRTKQKYVFETYIRNSRPRSAYNESRSTTFFSQKVLILFYFSMKCHSLIRAFPGH